MDEKEMKNDPSLPPDYVSLAQLQERWLQKRQEKSLKEKQEKERKQSETGTQNENRNQRGVKTDGHEKMEGRSTRDVLHRRIEKYGGEMGAIEEKGKGKEIIIGGFGNGDKKKKYAPDGEKGNGAKNEKPMSEIKHCNEGFDGCEGVEIMPRSEVKLGIPGENSGKERNSGELKGIEETVSVSMVEVLPRNELRRGVPNVKRMEFRGGFRRNGDNRASFYKSKREYIVKHRNEVKLDSEKEMEDGKKWREKRVNGDNGEKDYSFKDSNEVELKPEKKADDEILVVASEMDGLKVRERNGLLGQIKVKDNRIEEEEGLNAKKKVESGENGKKCEGRNELRRYRNWSGNIGRKFGGWKGDNVRSRVEMNVGESRRYARFENRRKMEQRDSSMVWVKKEDKSDAAEVASSGILVDWEQLKLT